MRRVLLGFAVGLVVAVAAYFRGVAVGEEDALDSTYGAGSWEGGG